MTIQHHLTVTRGFGLSDEDLRGIDDIYSQFSEFGPALSHPSRARVGSGGGVGGGGGVGWRRGFNRFPTWSEMARQTDGEGRPHGYLASHEHFMTIKAMQMKNLIVPVVIRSVSPRDGYFGLPQGPDGRANVLDPIRPLVRAFGTGRIQGYRDVTGRAR